VESVRVIVRVALVSTLRVAEGKRLVPRVRLLCRETALKSSFSVALERSIALAPAITSSEEVAVEPLLPTPIVAPEKTPALRVRVALPVTLACVP